MNTATPAARPQGSRMAGLEALRGIAALCVVFLHTRAIFGGFPPVFGKGYLGVDFFLMLSGYLMARGQDAKLARGATRPWRFMWARYRRLWPMMALGGLLGAPLLFMRTSGWEQFLMLAVPNFLLIPVSFQRLIFPLNVPAWTIFYELLANLLHVLLFWRLGRAGLAAAIALLVPVMAWIGLEYDTFDIGARPEHGLLGLPRIIFAYLIGMALQRWWRDEPSVPVPAWLAFIAMPVLIVGSWWTGLGGWIFDMAFVTLACPLIIAGGLRLGGQPLWARLSGKLSFPLFAVHMPILQAARWMGLGYVVGAAIAVAGGVCVAFGQAGIQRWKARRARLATA